MTHAEDRIMSLQHEVQILKSENTRLKHAVDAICRENEILRKEVARPATEVFEVKDTDGKRCRTGVSG